MKYKKEDMLGYYSCKDKISIPCNIGAAISDFVVAYNKYTAKVIDFNESSQKITLIDIFKLDGHGSRFSVDLNVNTFLYHFNKATLRKPESDIGDELTSLIQEAKNKHEGDYAEVERANRRIAAVEEALGKMRVCNVGITVGDTEIIFNEGSLRVWKDEDGWTVRDASAATRLFVSEHLEKLMKEAIKRIK